MASSSNSHAPKPLSPEPPSPTDDKTSEPQEKVVKKSGFASRLNNVWKKTGLDVGTLMLMAKGGLPPAISLAIYQSNSAAHTFTTLGYLLAIVSILSFAILPRAKFIQTMLYNVISICLAAAVSLLLIFCAVKARQHTQGKKTPSSVVQYNSSASAVCGIWLFFQIYVVNSVRAKFPQFAFPVILYSIFVNVSSIYAPQFATMVQGMAFARRLLITFLTGFGIATGVSLFIYPVTSRKVVVKEMIGYIGALRKTLKTHAAYFESIEHEDMFGRVATYDSRVEKIGTNGMKVYSEEAEAIKAAVRGITELHGKLHGDLVFAKREVAFGCLGPDDLQEIFRHLRTTMIPLVGLSSVVDVFQRLSEYNKWNEPIEGDAFDVHSQAARIRIVQEWNEIMKAVHDPFQSMIQLIDEGLQHVLYTMRLEKHPKKKDDATAVGDVEATAANTAPGDKGFAEYLDKRSNYFHSGKQIALRAWCDEKGIELPPDFFDRPTASPIEVPEEIPHDSGATHERNQRQLYLVLYMEFLLYSTSRAVLEFVKFADAKAESGKLSRKRLIVPGYKRVRKWVASTFKVEDSHGDDSIGDVNSQNNTLYLGEAYRTRKDPEHLPPETGFQKFGDFLRKLPRFLRSPESVFGFRVACATMSIAIIAFLHDTQAFFIKQRLVWAMIMVAISMSPTAGQSIFGFLSRVFGTALAVAATFCVWYIPDGKTPGVLVFLFLFSAMAFYIPIKKPRFVIVGIIGTVTLSLIIGYELEVRKIGKAVATSNGQEFYPVYLLAPYRLAAVAGGLAVAFIWTIFPYPISEHSVLRKSLGASLYLLANYYSIVHETVNARIRGDEGDLTLKGAPGRRLEKARNKVYAKQMLMLNGLRTYTGFLRWEVPIGGKFPKEQYDTIIQCMQNIVNYVSLVVYASDTFTHVHNDCGSESTWFKDFRRLIATANITTHEITSLLALLSASISNGQPLPPYLKAPKPYALSKRLEEIDKDILSVRHIAEPGYAAFAVLQISTRCIIGDLEKLLKNVKKLVGELDFSFHVVSTRDAETRQNSSDTLFSRSGERERKKAD